MIPIAGIVLGAAFGLWRARSGTRLDKLWLASIFAIIGGLLGVLIAVLLVRNA